MKLRLLGGAAGRLSIETKRVGTMALHKHEVDTKATVPALISPTPRSAKRRHEATAISFTCQGIVGATLSGTPTNSLAKRRGTPLAMTR
jgi:hypothetical protein